MQGFKNQTDQYVLDSRPLQRGNLCTVHRGVHKITGKKVAVKAIDKEKLEVSGSSQFQNEAAILYQCRHQQIIKCVEVFETAQEILMVTEFCPGGDLQMYMENRGFEALDEDNAREIVLKIA